MSSDIAIRADQLCKRYQLFDRVDRWVVEGGAYTVEVGASSRDLRATATVEVAGDTVRIPLSLNSSVADLMGDPIAGPVVQQVMAGVFGGGNEGMDAAGASMMANDEGLAKMLGSLPIGRLASFPGAPVTLDDVQQLIDRANAAG